MGGGTSSYREIEETNCILLWGSNARETHPIFFHHLLKGLRHGARMYAIDPRRTSSAAFCPSSTSWAGEYLFLSGAILVWAQVGESPTSAITPTAASL